MIRAYTKKIKKIVVPVYGWYYIIHYYNNLIRSIRRNVVEQICMKFQNNNKLQEIGVESLFKEKKTV